MQYALSEPTGDPSLTMKDGKNAEVMESLSAELAADVSKGKEIMPWVVVYTKDGVVPGEVSQVLGFREVMISGSKPFRDVSNLINS